MISDLGIVRMPLGGIRRHRGVSAGLTSSRANIAMRAPPTVLTLRPAGMPVDQEDGTIVITERELLPCNASAVSCRQGNHAELRSKIV